MALRDSLEIVPETPEVPLKPDVLCGKRGGIPTQYAFGDSLSREAGFSVLGTQLSTSHVAGRVSFQFAGTCRTGAACDPGPGSGTGFAISSALNRGTIWSAIASAYTAEAISTAPSLTSSS